MATKLLLAVLLVALWSPARPAWAQAVADTVASGLMAPIGLEIDARGWIWVAEQGTGNDDGQISIVTPDGQVYPFVTGLRSFIFEDGPTSVTHMAFHDGSLYAALGQGSEEPEGFLVRADTTGFAPGDDPFAAEDVELIEIGTFVADQGIEENNAYNLILGPEDDLFIVDAGANALLRRDQESGDLSVFATFDPIANPTPEVGAPEIHAVPTGIVYTDDRFFVSALTGFPFIADSSRVYEVDLDGNVTVHQTNLTGAVDLAVNPVTGDLVVLEFGAFDMATGFVPGTGSAIALTDDGPRTVVDGLVLTPGLAFDDEGNLYVVSLTGSIVRYEAATVTDVEAEPALPGAFVLHQNYPNPFNPSTVLRYEAKQAGHVLLTVHDLLGREVTTLVNGPVAAGVHEAGWNGRDAGGNLVTSGVYLARMEAGGQVQTRSLLLIK